MYKRQVVNSYYADIAGKTGIYVKDSAGITDADKSQSTMGDGRYPFDYDIVLKEAAKQNKLVELNNNSFRSRPGSESNCLLIAQKCKEYGVKVVINSDAHFTTMVGKFTTSLATAREAGIPASQIVNSSVENLADYLNNRTEKQKILF